MPGIKPFAAALALAASLCAQLPQNKPGDTLLPNGWRLDPAGRHAVTPDYILNLAITPGANRIVALNSGYNPHGLTVLDPGKMEAVQKVGLKSSWLGLAWSPSGDMLYVSGGNGQSRVFPSAAPVYGFRHSNGHLSEKPDVELRHRLPLNEIYWSGLAHHPKKPLLYAANRGTRAVPGHVAVFDTSTNKLVAELPTEIHPYDLVLDTTGDTLYVSNWSSRSVSVIDTSTHKVKAVLRVGANPYDMVLNRDGRLFVACSNENSVYVIDTKSLRPVEVIRTSMYRMAPVGSTPNALAIDPSGKLLFIANADNNNVAVVDIS
jgi:YVTN family beta-propeller protein